MFKRWGSTSGPAGGSVPVEPKEWFDESGERFFGMENFGNTCYANSVLQALYFSKPFRALIESYVPPSDSPASNVPTFFPPTAPLSPGAALSRTISPRRPNTANSLTSPPSPSRAFSAQSSSSGSSGKKSSSRPGTSAGKTSLANVFGSNSGDSTSSNGAASTSSSPRGRLAGGTGGLESASSNSIAAVSLPPPIPAESTLLTTLHDLFAAISAQPKMSGTVAPQAFINQVKKDNEFFRSTLHQDAHEFLNYLINMIAESVEKEDKGKEKRLLGKEKDEMKTWVHQLFEGILTNETRCLTCETVTSRDEEFLDLSIDIEPNSSITACLRQFSASEMLRHRNKFHCDQCCGLQEAEKRMKIKKLPNVLALHLKRFKYEESLQRHVKLNYRVVFPFELRLFNTADGIGNPDRLYKLWAIIVHIGLGPHHGHYITIIKSGARWVVFDDNTVQPIEESEISKFFGDTPSQGSGYVLFYEAADLEFNVESNSSKPPIPTSTSHSIDSHVSEPISIITTGLGLQVNNVDLSTVVSPTPDMNHSFFARGSTDQPVPFPIPSAEATTSFTPSSVTSEPSSGSPTSTNRPILPSSPVKESGWGVKGRKSMTSRIGRGLSLGGASSSPPKLPVSPTIASPSPLVPTTPLEPLVFSRTTEAIPPEAVSAKEETNGASYETLSKVPPIPASLVDDLPAPIPSTAKDVDDAVSITTTTTSSPSILSPPSFPAALDIRRGSKSSLIEGTAARFSFLSRKSRPSSSAGTNSIPLPISTPSLHPVVMGTNNSNGAALASLPSTASEHFSPLAARNRTSSESWQKKDSERRSKEEKKLREKELEKRTKLLKEEQKKLIKEEAKRVKEEAEHLKREIKSRKSSLVG